MFVLILIAILVIIIASLILHARWNYGVLEAMGIPIVKRHFLLGSTYNLHNEVVPLEDIARLKKYGSVYGVYEGRDPQVHISDPDIIKAILVKDFDHFNGRRNLEFGSPLMNEMPDFIQDTAKWKFVRQITSPTLTPAKVKTMSSSMKESLQEFADGLKNNLKKNGDKPLSMDVRQAIFAMLTDLIARSAFGVKVDNNNDVNNEFVRIVKQIVEGDPTAGVSKPNIFLPISLSFPFVKLFLPNLLNTEAGENFVKIFKTILENRKKSGRVQKDYTDTVIGWMEKLDSPEFKEVNVTELTVMMQALVMFFAGEDQISTIMTYMLLEVSKSPEIEKKLLTEIDEFLAKHNGEIEYEHLTELTYLSACINESLRLVPFFIRLERVCTKDWEMNGLKIKKGMTIIVPIWAVNRHPEYFPDPEKYDPERFMPENKGNLHPYAFTSFGHGPRNCIGMRFALDTLILIGAHIYRDFRFHSDENSKVNFLPGSLFMGHCDPIHMAILKRDASK